MSLPIVQHPNPHPGFIGHLCQRCGETDDTIKHHDDYAKPDEIRWLCRPCHKAWHREHGPGKNRDSLKPERPSASLQDRDQAIIAMYDGGATLEEVGQLLGISRERVRQILRRNGHTNRHHGKRLDPVRIARLADQGLAAHQIAHRIGTSTAVIRELATEFEIAIPGPVPARIAARQRRMVESLRTLAARLGRTPTLGEFAAAYFPGSKPCSAGALIAGTWGTHRKPGGYAVATRELYQRAGLSVRARGAAGHRQVAPKRRRYDYAQIRALREQGLKFREIRARLGIANDGTIRAALREGDQHQHDTNDARRSRRQPHSARPNEP